MLNMLRKHFRHQNNHNHHHHEIDKGLVHFLTWFKLNFPTTPSETDRIYLFLFHCKVVYSRNFIRELDIVSHLPCYAILFNI
jgi:hypothetical protein